MSVSIFILYERLREKISRFSLVRDLSFFLEKRELIMNNEHFKEKKDEIYSFFFLKKTSTRTNKRNKISSLIYIKMAKYNMFFKIEVLFQVMSHHFRLCQSVSAFNQSKRLSKRF